MKCQQCGHETQSGMFCTNCGSPLENPKTDETFVSELESLGHNPEVSEVEEIPVPSTDSEPQFMNQDTASTSHEEQPKQSKKDFSDQLATVFSNFGHFFITLVKQPSQARKANHNDLYSAIITIFAYVLILALSAFLPHAFYARRSWFIPVPSFFYEFLMPFILLLVTFGGIVSLVFVTTKVAKADLTYSSVVGKYGAYLLPYALLYFAGLLISVGHLPILPSILITIGILGPIFVIPALILYEKEHVGFDRIYLLFGLYFVEILFILLIGNSLFGGFIGDLFFLLP
jgi:hypothetical protein